MAHPLINYAHLANEPFAGQKVGALENYSLGPDSRFTTEASWTSGPRENGRPKPGGVFSKQNIRPQKRLVKKQDRLVNNTELLVNENQGPKRGTVDVSAARKFGKQKKGVHRNFDGPGGKTLVNESRAPADSPGWHRNLLNCVLCCNTWKTCGFEARLGPLWRRSIPNTMSFG